MQQSNINDLHPVITHILKNRGFQKNDLTEFFSWNLNQLPDLTALKDITKAAKLILDAIDNNKSIGIYGDYDVDGTTSCALLYHFFKMINTSVKLFQPDRFIEGYGLHTSSIDKAIKEEINILITVDCGITNYDAAKYAQEKNIQLIITDHHKDNPENELPVGLVINPNRRDEPDESPLKCLAGVGVAFSLALAIKNALEKRGDQCPSIYPLLEMVAIGTISDLAPLQPVNLKLVRHGLKQIPKSNYVGIKKFLDKEHFRMAMLPSEHISFNIGPRINSKGRLDHPRKALELLITDDSETAFLNFNQLDNCNNERKHLQNDIFTEANKIIKKEMLNDQNNINICYAPHWHEGVIGIVASKLVEEFNIPAIVFTNSNDPNILKASARTAGSLNLFDCLKNCSDLFIKFGGHAAAAGLSMKKENLPVFKSRMNYMLSEIPYITRTNTLSHDHELKLQNISPTLLKQLELLEPFGNGNPKPIFRSCSIRLDSFDILREKHVRWNIGCYDNKSVRLKGISFNYIDSWGNTHPEDLYQQQQTSNEPLWVWYNLGINRWNGNQYIQLMIKKIKFSF